MGPIVSLVRRHILRELPGDLWFWQAKGYSARHAASVERDVAVWEAWRAIYAQLGWLFRHDNVTPGRWLTRPNSRLGGEMPALYAQRPGRLEALRRWLEQT